MNDNFQKDCMLELVEIDNNIELAQIALRGWNDLLRYQMSNKEYLIKRHGSLQYELYLINLKTQVSDSTKRLKELREQRDTMVALSAYGEVIFNQNK